MPDLMSSSLYSFCKVIKGSAYYVVAMAQLPNREPVTQLAALRKDLNLSPSFEFHFYKMNSRQKNAFFEAIRPLSFRARVAMFIKSQTPPGYKGLDSTELATRLLVELTLRASPLDIANDILVLDDKPESFIQSLRIHFTQAYKQARRDRPFKKIVSSKSTFDDGLQIADMIAGAMRQFGWENDTTYFQMFSSKMVDLWQVG
ncbi:MAG: hypothetical protein BroJett001_06300 [Chloroflexota bacterium]|nr:hypothetical protein [Chloroflexota bacterium]MDL1926013.1 hypothetical protein [Anaerolineae bacterium AMX1]GIK08564.1 MAG: hypothetical protein BroJett001_06300 [Chloroflexota bacterium]